MVYTCSFALNHAPVTLLTFCFCIVRLVCSFNLILSCVSETPIGVMDDAFVAVLYLLGIVIPRQGSLHSVLFEVAVGCGYCVDGN